MTTSRCRVSCKLIKQPFLFLYHTDDTSGDTSHQLSAAGSSQVSGGQQRDQQQIEIDEEEELQAAIALSLAASASAASSNTAQSNSNTYTNTTAASQSSAGKTVYHTARMYNVNLLNGLFCDIGLLAFMILYVIWHNYDIICCVRTKVSHFCLNRWGETFYIVDFSSHKTYRDSVFIIL